MKNICHLKIAKARRHVPSKYVRCIWWHVKFSKPEAISWLLGHYNLS